MLDRKVMHADAERRFYSGAAIVMIVLVLIGFAPSFYFRGLVHYPRPNPEISVLVLLHGLMFSGWMLIFLMQARLIASGRRDLHMKLGLWSMMFAASLIPLMIATTIGQVARANQPPGYTPLGWMAVPAFGIPVYTAFLWAGWTKRRDPQAHKRYMLGAALLMMDPAIGRILLPPEAGIHLPTCSGGCPFSPSSSGICARAVAFTQRRSCCGRLGVWCSSCVALRSPVRCGNEWQVRLWHLREGDWHRSAERLFSLRSGQDYQCGPSRD